MRAASADGDGRTYRVAGHELHGLPVDAQTRCVHYRGPLDVIAIRMSCCDRFHPCHLCHEETADHPLTPWPADAGEERAVLCGVCGTTLRIDEYLTVECCPSCGAAFNPGCALHHDLYFDGRR